MTDMGYRALIGAIMDRDVEQIETVIEDTFDRALILMGRSNNWDGWRIDGSIYGHGPQLHNATYGREMSLSTVNATSLLYDSPWDLGRDVIDQLEHAILNGLLRMSWGEWFDFNAAGRGVSRPGSRSFAAGYIIIIEDLLELNPSQPEKLEMVLDRILDGPTPEQGFSSTQSYVYSDFITHIRPDYYSSIRMISNRTKRNEGALNNEGMKNLYFGDGIQFTVVHGDEYANLPPVWNYARLPGLTARQESNLTPPPVLGERGSAVFANSLTDGRTGLAGMRLQHRDTRGWKTWFAVKEGIVALGSGIQVTSGTANEEVLTTVNQTLYGGEARLGTAMNGEEALEGSFSLTSDEAAWAWNRDIGYLIFGDNDDLTVQAESVTGDWSDVGASSGSVTNDVFTLYFDHGIQPSNAGYSYMVLPTASSRQTQAYASEMPVEILRKDGGVHAIRHRKTGAVYIVFLQADSLVVDDSLTVESNGKALVQLVPHLGSWKVLVADPEFNREAAIVSLHNGDVVEELSVDLPDGDHVGMPATAYAWNSTAPMRSIESESPFSGPWKQAGFGPYLPTDDAWIYHGRLGWVQTVTDADENIYLHPAEEDDWYWTRAELAGWAYHFENKEWVRLN